MGNKEFMLDDFPGLNLFSPEGLHFMKLAGTETDAEAVHALIGKLADVINVADINNATAAMTMIALLCALYERFEKREGGLPAHLLPYSLN